MRHPPRVPDRLRLGRAEQNHEVPAHWERGTSHHGRTSRTRHAVTYDPYWEITTTTRLGDYYGEPPQCWTEPSIEVPSETSVLSEWEPFSIQRTEAGWVVFWRRRLQ